ncbi:MAG TPA: NAD(P)/FAD-dependent oxidoreductase [Candidatus Megaira endosymbiont of Nemacystus decipiens]|nr:NAD(P)/FAD-dependent oxidoreductase [Candidatus Megaera endosymbiont of Nemacystus decipiens]
MVKTDVAIIGAGPVGLFAAFQAGILGMKSCVVDTLDEIGGQCCALYPDKPIYDIPGLPKIAASKLIENLYEQARPFAPQYLLSQQVNSMSQHNNFFKLGTSTGNILEAKVVLIAAGAGAFGPNKPPLENIEQYEGSSVFYLVSNREKFANKKVVIAGGGDSAVDWAISLSSISDVTIVHRREKFRAVTGSIQKLYELAEKGAVKIITNYQLSRLEGSENILQKVVISDLDKNEKHLKADILLPFFGLKQNLGPLGNFGIDIKLNHILVSTPYYLTNIPGVYAVGDVAHYEGKLKLILTGFAEVASSLHHSYSRVFDGKPLHFEYSTSKGIG